MSPVGTCMVVPVGVAIERPARIRCAKHFGADGLRDRGLHFLRRRPDIPQINGLPSLPVPSGSVRQIDVDAAGQRIRHNQRRRRKIVRLHQRIDAAFEVAVAAEHRRDDQVFLLHGLRDGFRQRAAVADAGGAAVADQIEIQLLPGRASARLRVR